MKHLRSFPAVTLLTLGWMVLAVVSACPAPPEPAAPIRSLKICVASDASPEVRGAAQALLQAVDTHALLQTMGKENAPHSLTDSKALTIASPEERAYSHLVVVGLPNDPLIQGLWQREAKTEEDGFYIYGWGHLRGDVGYIESDRNPFLHSFAIAAAPFETEVVTITGATPRAVDAAVSAFLKSGLVNGVVAGAGWRRAQTSLLDRDPLPIDAGAPEWVPSSAGAMKRIAVAAAGEDEYRGVLQDTDVEPLEIWRVKYLADGGWDCAGAAKANDAYEAGLHRRASGNTLWVARFSSVKEAGECMAKIAKGAKLQLKEGAYYGERPGFSRGPSAGPYALWQRGDWLLMSTLPEAETKALAAALHR